MLGTIRNLKMTLAERVSGHWCPPADEAWTTFRPLPWEVDGSGQLRRRTLENIAAIAARNWLATAGPGRAGTRRVANAVVSEIEATAVAKTLAKLTVSTRLRGREGRNWHLMHRIEDPSGRAVAIFNSRLVVSSQAEWSVFPPYRVAGVASILVPSTALGDVRTDMGGEVI